MKILLADDAATSRFLLQRAVEELGHECVVAEDGQDAWEKFQDADAEVVISDWMMPRMDGDELCRRIREDTVRTYTYFIMLTSLEDKEHVLQGMRVGADDYLTKPLDRHELEVRLIAASRVSALHRELAKRQQAIQSEVEMAADIQSGLLPARPPEVEGVELAGTCVPAANVGGDLYDFVTDDKGRVMLMIADVAGHSIASALLGAMARATLRREIHDGKTPWEVLAATNSAMYADLVSAGLFVTVFCARYDPARGRLEFGDAGHNPPMIRTQAGEVSELSSDGAAVGILPEEEYEPGEVPFGPGDSLLLYTDGVVEAAAPDGAQFGEERLRAVIRRADGAGAKELNAAVLDAVQAYADGVPQKDDVTLVAMRAEAA